MKYGGYFNDIYGNKSPKANEESSNIILKGEDY